MYKTRVTTPTDIIRVWYLVDATDVSLGRIASKVAQTLRGKGKGNFSYNVDGGDFVVVINSDKMKITGDKLVQKKYYHHTGYMGHLRSLTLQQVMERDSTQAIMSAVKGMLPRTKQAAHMLKRLKVFKGQEHTFNHITFA
ncbi:50S ribosomal protein L13 [Candidatus Wirthbacteria bacterium CG2_30_54_11]|uniref:Large ribosomal subunit protein uL13 n=1 Tax=Candidatus Wirthbacteria bacterium CG2_30_54_11 TaxID=1817892 RepID=A0A1J5IPS4_9BACT|nr:MAG: 50S ribosomal protein L13 [Candidatus Wirthbacteria bacterium CG2_30_54_11]